jgi:hypothetical protein
MFRKEKEVESFPAEVRELPSSDHPALCRLPRKLYFLRSKDKQFETLGRISIEVIRDPFVFYPFLFLENT